MNHEMQFRFEPEPSWAKCAPVTETLPGALTRSVDASTNAGINLRHANRNRK